MEYYGDVTVIQKMRLRVCAEHTGEMTKKLMLSMLQNQTVEDILDEEVLGIISVEEVGETDDK